MGSEFLGICTKSMKIAVLLPGGRNFENSHYQQRKYRTLITNMARNKHSKETQRTRVFLPLFPKRSRSSCCSIQPKLTKRNEDGLSTSFQLMT
ncbi:uncharacterized protein LOC143251207 isoform X2 [Tachypleus tridentatus]|uniref:uncharacterized protein LOC143251207 isoform X2 n=1 Tax=Tachypleus tridentatus TaxID=6853 RepID=UPI003FD264A0